MKILLLAVVSGLLVLPAQALACACGCGVFDVGGDTMVAPASGAELLVEYDLLDQIQNWSGATKAPAAANSDKQIRSNFVIIAGQVKVSRDWSVMVEVPITDRSFRTTDPGQPTTFHDTSLGDVRLMGVYSGLSADRSTGLIVGAKVPTGDWRARGFTRDVEIGSGSTDLIVGGYHGGPIGRSGDWTYLVQALAGIPVTEQGGYRPGAEFDSSASISYGGWSPTGNKVTIKPLLQLIAAVRGADGGAAGDADNTGYQRLLVSPGIQVTVGRWMVYGDVEFPVYQNVRGNQLVAPDQFKFVLSRAFQ